MKVKKIHKKLFLILIGLILFFPFRTAHADIFGISESFWGYLEMALDALDFFDSTILNFLWKILVLLVSSYGLSLIGAGVFDWAVNLPINLGIADPSKNPMIWAGWNFCRGIANIFLIVILALIAITYILRIQTLGGKKALARLIIVALLLNFSMFFVGAAVDLTNIIINGIISALGGVNLTSLILSNLTPAYTSLITLYTGWLVGYFATALIPIANVAYIVGMIFFFILALFLGFLLFTFVIIILGFVLGFVTLIIGILFLFRIAIIWILTIISPLAFLCWILPQTKKYWNDWIKLLTQWLIWGILAVFFVGLGIKLSGVMPKPTSDIQLFGVTVFPAVIGQYLFLIVYFGVVYYFVLKQYTPELAAFLMGAATGILARGAPIVTAPIRRRVGKRYERFLAEQKKREEMFKEKEKRREKLTMKEKLQKYGGKIAAAPGLLYYRMRKTTPEIEARKRIGEAKKKMNVLTTDSLREVLKNPRANAIERVTAMEILAERGKLKDEYTKYLDFYRIQHGDVGKILKARPDWAPHFEKSIKEQIEKISPRDFVRYTQPEVLQKGEVLKNMSVQQLKAILTRGTILQKEALTKPLESEEVFINMEVQKLREILTRGTVAHREALRRLLAEKEKEIRDKLEELKREGKMTEYRRGLETYTEAKRHPALYPSKKEKPSYIA